ncbi:hypothetical protein [Methylobacterium planeticum]|uniref:Uncharacterized protein n=1 Tax=Methylobacterium planeticum TaxID=2615211 RepID=A0A6N6MDN6_9HYPH|nr:hypothetical protein [Methylobacterium planeticum]KAB1068828.1 hypothetical protein F6X51_26295 [Methylobacterium planeticum]
MKDKQGRRVLPNLINPQPEPAPDLWADIEPLSPEECRAMDEFSAYLQQEEEEIEAIKANRPLGSVVAREPKSLEFSKVPDPVWKRKLWP